MQRFALFRLLVAGVWSFVAGRAHADTKTLSGRWSATPLTSDWNIGDWGRACGPEPNGGSAPGGVVTITSTGAELQLKGAGRDYSTSECWEQFPGLARVGHSGGARAWRTTCKTNASDPRQATVITNVAATDDRITFDETGQYQFVVSGQNCTASVRRSRLLSLLEREGEAPPGAVSVAAPAAPAPSSAGPPATSRAPACQNPGPPARLEVRPSKKLMRAGESFEFRSMVFDSNGCRLSQLPVWKWVSANPALELTGPGKVRVLEGAPEATVELQATVKGRSARVVIEIASPRQYDALLAQRGLNAEGESSEAAAARLATSELGGRSVTARDDSQRQRLLFVGVVGGAALLLGLLGFVLVQRGRRKPKPAERDVTLPSKPAAVTPSSLPGFTKVCPTCREEYPPDAGFCPNDGNRLIAARGQIEPNSPGGGVCPVCGLGYDPGVATCPKHGEELVPVALQATHRLGAGPASNKICPMCGTQYTGDSQFCGSCGAALVPVN